MNKVGRKGIVVRINNGGFERVDMPLAHRGGSEKIAARSRKHGPT